MAVSHADWKKPFCGIQFHPESISSSEQAQRVVRHWWLMAKQWIQECGANRDQAAQLKAHKNFCATQELLRGMLRPEPDLQILHEDYDHPLLNRSPSRVKCLTKTISGTARVLSVPAICDLLGIHASDCIVLDSEVKAMQDAATESQGANTGTYSIIGIIEPDTTRIEYQVGNSLVYLRTNGVLSCKDLAPHEGSIFTFLKNFMAYHKLQASEADLLPVPFRGGLMGYITYEEPPIHPRPDVCFAFVARSIVVDHRSNNIYIQSIKTMDQEWLSYVHGMLMQSHLPSPHCTELMQAYGISGTEQQHRDKINQYVSLVNKNNGPRRLYEAYESRMLASQRQIPRGLSYELCVTDQATLIMPSLKNSSVYQPCADRHPSRFGRSRWDASPVDWSVYLRLRKINAAPFSAYVRLGPLTPLSTSPERFMSWDRPHVGFDKDGTYAVVQNCQFRPIKGTVRKSYPDGIQVTLDEATRKLATKKERAENLMIVDLIRHDLHGVVGAGNVNVSQLMAVEEYATVYQLVSVVEGKLFSTKALGKTGIDVLAASLPPGSMTGAPKLRSCQLLKRFDGNPPRSVYSGVLGYMCVSGGGDFSVVIRSMFK
ncbi:MAG: hypothetical protein FRX48_01786 [Lasallia pustulata]|uniref:Uncharacterized protein n=1 Tax=Lasallia pustulata TaxID=136370 RepID=A0A5M8Q0Z5_9LECA|nr:MAG: hypothetical protein FRX48_01786 [Lasallia pustulata]